MPSSPSRANHQPLRIHFPAQDPPKHLPTALVPKYLARAAIDRYSGNSDTHVYLPSLNRFFCFLFLCWQFGSCFCTGLSALLPSLLPTTLHTQQHHYHYHCCSSATANRPEPAFPKSRKRRRQPHSAQSYSSRSLGCVTTRTHLTDPPAFPSWAY